MTEATNSFDLYAREALLGEEERLVRNTVAAFVDREVLPVIGRCFAEQRFPAELMPGMAELGLFGATLRGYGGSGVSNRMISPRISPVSISATLSAGTQLNASLHSTRSAITHDSARPK